MEAKIKQVQDKCAEYGWATSTIPRDTEKRVNLLLYNKAGRCVVRFEIKPKNWVAYDGGKSEKLMSGTTEPADGVQKLLEQYYYCQKLKQ